MLHAAPHLPPGLRAEAAVTACYQRNRVVTASSTKTLWELFYGAKPDVSRLRVFGSQAYALKPAAQRAGKFGSLTPKP